MATCKIQPAKQKSDSPGSRRHILAGSLPVSFLFLVVGCSLIPHPRPWTKREKLAATFFIAAHTANAFSTENHQDNRDCYERNPLLGRHPSDTEIGAYFSITGILTLLIADWYPELREPLLFGYGGVNLGLAVSDYKMIKEIK